MNTDDMELSTRKAPDEKANMYAEGYAMDGSDGCLYVVKATKNGIKRWTKVTTTTKKDEPKKKAAAAKKDDAEKDKESEAEKKAEKAEPKKTAKETAKEPEKPKTAKEPEEEPEPAKKKTTTRKAPAKKANAHDEGYETDGSDGNPYVVKADKNGIKKWMKQKEEKPKRAPTAYTNFIKVTLPELRKKHTDKKTSECMSMAGAIWKALPEDEKKAFLA